MSECDTKDIERLLRSVPAKMLGTEYEPAYLLCHVAADELARLRAENEAICKSYDQQVTTAFAEILKLRDEVEYWKHKAS